MEYIATGVLRSSHGLEGNIRIKTYSGEYQYLRALDTVELRRDGKRITMTIDNMVEYGNELMIHFKGITTPEAVRVYNGWEVWVPREEASPLESGEFYVADLIGCDMIFDGKIAGKIVSSFDGAQSLLLEVEKPDGSRSLIPFMKEYIGAVSLEAGTIELLMGELLT